MLAWRLRQYCGNGPESARVTAIRRGGRGRGECGGRGRGGQGVAWVVGVDIHGVGVHVLCARGAVLRRGSSGSSGSGGHVLVHVTAGGANVPRHVLLLVTVRAMMGGDHNDQMNRSRGGLQVATHIGSAKDLVHLSERWRGSRKHEA